MNPEDINSPADLASYILEHADRIAVREQGSNTAWGSFYLTELPAAKALKHALGFVIEGRVPHFVKTEAPK